MRLLDLLTIPGKILTATFYTTIRHPDTYDVIYRHFSITRALYIAGTVVIIFRLLVGGMRIDGLAMGDDVAQSSHAVSMPVPIKSKRRRGRMARPVRALLASRPMYQIKSIVFSPLTVPEIMGYIVLVLLYYFSGSISSGDKDRTFSTFLDKMATGYARSKGYVKDAVRVSDPSESPASGFPVQDKSGKRRKSSKGTTAIEEAKDPFLEI